MSRRLAVLLLAGALLPAAAPAVAAAELAVPYLSGRVVDEAGLVPQEARQRIEAKLADLEQRTGIQMAVLTVESLEGESIDDYSLRVAETWKLGQKGKDNGALLLISEQDRKMRIEVGYGLEPELTDLDTGRIREDVIAPAFRSGDFGGGIERGVDAMIAAATGGEVPAAEPRRAVPEVAPGAKGMVLLVFVLVIGTFSLVALSSDGCMGWFLYLFLMPFYAIFPSVAIPGAGPVFVGIWAVAFPLLRIWFRKAGWGKKFRRGGGSGWPPFIFFPGGGSGRGGGGWSSGSGGGGFSGGGFSGGGGSFGGGGSSGSW